MISFRVVTKPKPIGDKIYGCVIIVRSKKPELLFQTFPTEVANAITADRVWHHETGHDLALCLENKRFLVKMFPNPSPLSDKEISDYLEFLARDAKEGELDVRSALGITVDGEVKRLRFGGQDEKVPETPVG